MGLRARIIIFFGGWIFLGLLSVALNAINIDWQKTPLWQGILLVVVIATLQGSVLELVVITIATLLVRKRKIPNRREVCDNLTLIMNYNLLALAKEDIEETYQRMYEAFLGNLHPSIATVLVSATNDNNLRQYELHVRDNYRAKIYDELMKEGEAFAASEYRDIDPFRLDNVWNKFAHLNMSTFVTERLPQICEAYTKDFMCIHRISRVLRKCGQYQDLMLLSEGDKLGYTYTDQTLYGSKARPYNQPLFVDSPDVDNIFRRRFNYTLVLDGDTRVPPSTAIDLLAIASGNPEYAIIQPAIIMDVDDKDTIFMHLEKLRQDINAPVTSAMAYVLGHSGYYGKALIKNSAYIHNVIGTRDHLIERVPIDVLSHDTFEAAVLKSYYAGSTALYEAPPFNYITWNIRERRWNKGEVLLSFYFWPLLIGKPMRALQAAIQGKNFVKTKLRTRSKLDFVSSYQAHSAYRQMWMKPLLLVFMILHINIHLHYSYLPIAIIMFLIIIFPKFATIRRNNLRKTLIEIFVSIIQFTPEAIVGCVRMVRAYQGNISTCCNWTPQRAVEQDFLRKNPFISSFKHLWVYSFVALTAGVLVAVFAQQLFLIYMMVTTLFLLPIYTAITSYTPRLRRVSPNTLLSYRDNILGSVENISDLTWQELALLIQPNVSLV